MRENEDEYLMTIYTLINTRTDTYINFIEYMMLKLKNLWNLSADSILKPIRYITRKALKQPTFHVWRHKVMSSTQVLFLVTSSFTVMKVLLFVPKEFTRMAYVLLPCHRKRVKLRNIIVGKSFERKFWIFQKLKELWE